MFDYRPDFFAIHELVCPNVNQRWGPKAFKFLDPRLLWTLDELRKAFGPITINNYALGGDRVASGLRIPGTPHYSTYSQHSFGRAADCLFRDVPVNVVRTSIINESWRASYQYIRGVELEVKWLHLDVRNTPSLETFKP